MIEVEGFTYTDGTLGAHIHLPDHQCANYSFHDVEAQHPALYSALEEVGRCIVGEVIIGCRSIAAEQLPESPEVDMALCKTCGTPVWRTTPGSRRHGPFVYCPRHA